MIRKKILGIDVIPYSKKIILEKIKKYLNKPVGFFHITSLNPENLVVASENSKFKKIINTSQLKIIDGVGIVIAGRLLGVKVGERVTGVGLMEELVKLADKLRLRVLLIGGRPKLAESIANCYKKKYLKARFLGIEGVKDIKKGMTNNEKERLYQIVIDFKPNLVFVAFGSPYQELWIEENKKMFEKRVVVGVGGAFDFLSGQVKRAPVFIRRLGLEWLFRLINQPWRLKRQLRLIKFGSLVMKEMLK